MSNGGPQVEDLVTSDLDALLGAESDEATRAHWTAYLKGTAQFRGVPMAGVRRAVRTIVHRHDVLALPDDGVLDIADHWFQQPNSEDKLAAVLLIAEHLAPRLRTDHAPRLARPLAGGHVADWNVCDWYATKALHAYLAPSGKAEHARAAQLLTWLDAPSLWQRRAALVAFVKTAADADRQFPGYARLVLQAAAGNLVSDDRFAHTGPGWVLRELSRTHPGLVANFLAEHPHLSPEARRMATAHLREGPYRRR